jgi:hypothetical protein
MFPAFLLPSFGEDSVQFAPFVQYNKAVALERLGPSFPGAFEQLLPFVGVAFQVGIEDHHLHIL